MLDHNALDKKKKKLVSLFICRQRIQNCAGKILQEA